jgi:hypothetical protein
MEVELKDNSGRQLSRNWFAFRVTESGDAGR